ncbi:MAG: ribonuclease P protein component [Oleiphilaceae bacterium]|nr:ribonuclease P protein component [Oleiphilaceae bacterium]
MTETSDNTFPKSIRLLNAKDYSDVFSGVDIKFATQYFLCLASKQELQHPKLGIIVAKKNVRFAVNRNRIKRVLRESFRQSQHKLPSYDLVFMAKRSAADAENENLNKELQYIWRKLKQRAKS